MQLHAQLVPCPSTSNVKLKRKWSTLLIHMNLHGNREPAVLRFWIVAESLLNNNDSRRLIRPALYSAFFEAQYLEAVNAARDWLCRIDRAAIRGVKFFFKQRSSDEGAPSIPRRWAIYVPTMYG
jgi:hypothetical protein